MNKALLIGAALIGLSMAAKKQTIGNSGLTSENYQTAIRTDTIGGIADSPLGKVVATNILNAKDATSALALGNAALNGLDVTNPYSVQVYSPTQGNENITVAQQVVNNQPQAIFDARGANAIINTTPPSEDDVILAENPGGAYPRWVGSILVQNPNQLEHLKHAVENKRH